MKPTTPEEALSLVPTHWMLDQKNDTVKAFDERYVGTGWETVSADDIGGPVWMAFRRPIPQDVRESIAEMILHAARETATDSAWAEDVLGRWILAGKP